MRRWCHLHNCRKLPGHEDCLSELQAQSGFARRRTYPARCNMAPPSSTQRRMASWPGSFEAGVYCRTELGYTDLYLRDRKVPAVGAPVAEESSSRQSWSWRLSTASELLASET